jgi:hypothetical protein
MKNIEELKDTFIDIEQLLKQDNGRMWGVNLYGALMFVNPATKDFIANEQNIAGTFTKEEDYFAGKLDEKTMIANTALEIDGKSWTMVMLPLPKDRDAKRELIVHELFHNIQDRLNLPQDAGTNSHLDGKTARIYLQLEWNALLRANLADNKSTRIMHIKNALIFREIRRMEYIGSEVKENCLELLEGLAEYTGVKLGIEKESKKKEFIAKKVENAVNSYPSFIRSFAYISGPLYGLLLDKTGTEWRKKINEKSDLGQLLAEILKINTNSDPRNKFNKTKHFYGFDKIEEFENRREERNIKTVNMYTDKFINNPVLILPNKKMQFQFNPSELIALGNTGNVYPHLMVVADWGTLTAEEGAVIASDWMSVLVSTPFRTEGNVLLGTGWKIKLNEKWKVIPKGTSFTLEESGN